MERATSSSKPAELCSLWEGKGRDLADLGAEVEELKRQHKWSADRVCASPFVSLYLRLPLFFTLFGFLIRLFFFLYQTGSFASERCRDIGGPL